MWIHRKTCAMLPVLRVGSLSLLPPSLLHASVIICLQQSDTLPFQHPGVEKALPFSPYGFANLKFFPEAWPTSLWVTAGWVTLNLEAATTISCCGVTNATRFSRLAETFFHTRLGICQILKMVNAQHFSSAFLALSRYPKALYKVPAWIHTHINCHGTMMGKHIDANLPFQPITYIVSGWILLFGGEISQVLLSKGVFLTGTATSLSWRERKKTWIIFYFIFFNSIKYHL